MNNIVSFRLRKCSDVNLDIPFFEVIDEKNEIIMDISESDNGERSILFHKACVGKSITLKLIEQLIAESENLLENEKS